MTKRLSLGEFLIATQGLALVRNLFDGSDTHTADRVRELREILAAMEEPDSIESMFVNTFEVDSLEGYATWSQTYDGPSNPLIECEEPALHAAISTVPSGRALDVCTGTGRVARMLASAKHRVTAVDQCAEMLAVAQNPSDASEIDYRQLPLDDDLANQVGSDFDLVSCSLALTHFSDLTRAITNLANTLRPGGTMLLTDAHPTSVLLSTQGSFNTGSDTPFVRNVVHPISSYLRAFQAAGLVVRECHEVTIGEGQGPMMTTIGMLRPEATRQAYLGIPLVLLWDLTKS